MVKLRLDARLPVMLITGSLGSGKTTLLNRLLATEEFREAAVAINEFGEAGLDGLFLEHFDGEALVIAGGCACCSLKTDFEEQILRIYSQVRDRAQPLRRLMIETSGIADPIPLIQFLIGSPLASKIYRIEKVVCTVDAVFGIRQLASSIESVNQAALADVLVVTKTDLNPDGESGLVQRLRTLNPRAEIMSVLEGGIEPAILLRGGAPTVESRASDVEQWLLGSQQREEAHGSTAEQNSLPTPQGGSVSSYTLIAERPLDEAAFLRWLTALRIAYSEQLLRIKGVVHFASRSAPVAIHGVHHIFHRMVELIRWRGAERRSVVVIIARSLDRASIEAGWAALEAAPMVDRVFGTKLDFGTYSHDE